MNSWYRKFKQRLTVCERILLYIQQRKFLGISSYRRSNSPRLLTDILRLHRDGSLRAHCHWFNYHYYPSSYEHVRCTNCSSSILRVRSARMGPARVRTHTVPSFIRILYWNMPQQSTNPNLRHSSKTRPMSLRMVQSTNLI